MGLRQRHEEHATLTKAHDFSQRVDLLVGALNPAQFSHRTKRPLALDDQTE
jgi:hypothetical protein